MSISQVKCPFDVELDMKVRISIVSGGGRSSQPLPGSGQPQQQARAAQRADIQ